MKMTAVSTKDERMRERERLKKNRNADNEDANERKGKK
jgi:hypothetical protein